MQIKFLFVISCFFSFFTFGQKFATSPFSSNGIGEIGTLDHATFSGIGNVTVSSIDSLNLNYFNPSSYSFLATGQPVFSTGISYKRSTFSEKDQSFSTGLTGINHFAMGIPFAKYFGVAFGVKPFSRTGYAIDETVALGTDSMHYRYLGSGGINESFGGFSAKVLNYKNNQLGLGANVGYLFGNFKNERFSNLTSTDDGGIETSKYQMKSLHYDFGLNYQLTLQKRMKLILAATYTPEQDLKTTKSHDLYFSKDVENENLIVDTISSTVESGAFSMPSTMNVGFAFSFRPKVDSTYNKLKIFQLSLFGSYSSTNWSSYSTNFTSDLNPNFQNTTKYNVGIEFIPHYNYLDRSKAIGYFNRVRYRAGYQYATLPIERLSKQLTDAAFTLGLSFPIVSQRSVSNINIGFTAGNRGNKDVNSLNEKYLGFNFGVSIAPGTADRWFRKYKID